MFAAIAVNAFCLMLLWGDPGMARLGSFCKLACAVLVPLTVGAQSMVSYGSAAATGSTAGTAAGNKLNKAIDSVFGSTGKVMGAAAATGAPKAEKTKPAELIHVSVVPEAATVPRMKASVAHGGLKPQEDGVAAEVVPMPPTPVITATPEAVAAVAAGTKRDDLGKLGQPAYKMSIPEDGHLVEVYRYQADGKLVGTVRLSDGVVTSVESAQP